MGPVDHTDSYLICATPRSGSSWLCGLLASTGVAGYPESYFREPDEPTWATRWNLDHCVDGTFAYADYVRAAIAAGSSDNGVFGARVMWDTLAHLIDNLSGIYPDGAGSDLRLLGRTFGRTRFIYLRRDDVVAQAVSRLRAEQTNIWFVTDATVNKRPRQEPQFDLARIDAFVHEIETHNAAWQAWFASQDIHPHTIRYEDLDADPVGTTSAILDGLGLQPPAGHKIGTSHRRLADQVNAEWIARYRSDLRRGR